MTRGSGLPLDDESVDRLRTAVMLTARRLRAAAAAESVNPTMLSRILAHLEGGGLIERTPDPEDARSTVARATTSGRRLIGRLRVRRAAVLRERLAELTPDENAALRAALPALEALARMDEGGR